MSVADNSMMKMGWTLSTEPQPGQCWLAYLKRFGLRLVLICDEDIVQTFFGSQGRPHSAREADGRWEPGFEDHTMKIGGRSFPVLFPRFLLLYIFKTFHGRADLPLSRKISI